MLVKEQLPKICSHCLRLCSCQMRGSHSRYALKSISLPSPAWYWSGRTNLYIFGAYWQMERWVMAILVCFVAILDLSQTTVVTSESHSVCHTGLDVMFSSICNFLDCYCYLIKSSFLFFATRNLQTIPTRGQNFVEYIYINYWRLN
jgi:hypothetical protein